MKFGKIFCAVCCIATLFAACDKDGEPTNDGKTDNSPIENPDTLVKKKYTLTVLSADTALGTVDGSGKYAAGTAVKITAMPKNGFVFALWSDAAVMEAEREITLVSDSTVTAWFCASSSHECVDLGLPSGLKWATCNVGADKPEEYGDYYAWGETETKQRYDWDTYKHGNGYANLFKYCTDANSGRDGFTDGKTQLDPIDDVVRVKWGGRWRMPTYDDWLELYNNCTWASATRNGVVGHEMVSKINGNRVFFPAAGNYDVKKHNEGLIGYYWSSSIYVTDQAYARCVKFYPDNLYALEHRYCGLSVRPVRE